MPREVAGTGEPPKAAYQEPTDDPYGLSKILMSMSLHTIDGRLIKIDKGLGALETWVQALIDGIEERVSNAFANQQEIIDKVEYRVDDVADDVEEMKKIHHRKNGGD